MRISARTINRWTVVFLLCAMAYVVGDGISLSHAAGCSTLRECRECVLDECDPDREGGYYTFTYSAGDCQYCCGNGCTEMSACDC